MITKIIHTGDLHIRNLERLNETYDILSRFVSECKEIIEGEESPENVRVVVCGDLVESKIHTSNECFLALGWFFRELDTLGCTVYVVCGNHDVSINNLTRVDAITTVMNIGNYTNIKYLDNELEFQSGCLVDDNVVWCLYSIFDDFNRPNIDEMKLREPDKTFVGLVHTDVNGSRTDTGYVSERGLDMKIFKGLDFVIAAHIHKFQELKKNGVRCVYCSSLIQQNFGENVSGHGYVVWDVENKSYEFKKMDNPARGFYKFIISDINDIENNTEEFQNF